MACRSKDKAEAVIKELKQETGRQTVYFIPLDLGDLSTIKNTVGIFTRSVCPSSLEERYLQQVFRAYDFTVPSR